MSFIDLAILGVLIVTVCFSFVLFFGAPFLPTLKPQIATALDLLDLKPGETMLELGCGDGRVLIAAAQRGWKGVGYELNPLLVLAARLRCWRYRGQVRVIWGNYWRASWPEAQGVFAFILPRYMRTLDKKVIQYKHKPLAIVSFAFAIPDKEAESEKDGVFLYEYK